MRLLPGTQGVAQDKGVGTKDMSSTNRGYDRHKSDYYVTPIDEIKKFLSAWLSDEQDGDDYNLLAETPDKLIWLDPCAGGDSSHPMSYPEALKEIGVEPATIDLRDDSLAELKADYLETEVFGYDVIITNPPFNIAQEIIEKALKESTYVVMLLRLNFLGSKQRFEFWQKHPAKKIYVHHKRMSFTGGPTDSIEYAHFVWQNGYDRPTEIEVI